jgi:catechol 2,3-dioxygenase-like lactoylglutathione lyase family enzyme
MSKPKDMYYRGFREKPSLPQISEIAEVAEALDKGIDVLSGHRTQESLPESYEVEGVLLPRPFKITKIGPVSLFVDDVERAETFYVERLGFTKSEEARYGGAASSCAAAPSTTASAVPHGSPPARPQRALGVRRSASRWAATPSPRVVAFLKSHGDLRRPDPARAYPGIDYSRSRSIRRALHPAYYYGAGGWDGRVPAAERRRVNGAWPETLEPLSDTHVDRLSGPAGLAGCGSLAP